LRFCIVWSKVAKVSEESVAVFDFTPASLPFYTLKMEVRGFSASLVNWCRFRRYVTSQKVTGFSRLHESWHLRWEKVFPNNKQTSLMHQLVTCILSCLYLYSATLSVESISKWVEIYDTWILEVKGMKSLASWGWCHRLRLTNRITLTLPTVEFCENVCLCQIKRRVGGNCQVSRTCWVDYEIS